MKLESYNNLFFQSSNPYQLLRHTANENVLDIRLLEILFFFFKRHYILIMQSFWV